MARPVLMGLLFPFTLAVFAALSCYSLLAQTPAASVLPPGVDPTGAGATALAAAAHQQTVALLITQVFGFLALLSGIAWKGYAEARDRRWAREDGRAQEQAAAKHREDVIAGLAEAKQAASLAYSEANNVNLKIASIGMQMRTDPPCPEGTRP